MPKPTFDRRQFLAVAIPGAVVASAFAQAPQQPVSPEPTRRDWTGQDPIRYPDPDIVALDNRFRRYIIGNTVMKRLHTGTLWAEGPAWSGAGRYLLWSDIPNNVQMRWIEDDGRVTVFRNPSGYSNGNTFDYEGRQLSSEHGGRRVVRYETNGTVTVIAEKFEGKPLNSPNDLVVHPDGSIWFTDPAYGINGNYEGFQAQRELKEAVYRVDGKTKQIVKVSEEVGSPNGICFSPDYKKLYVADTGAPREIKVWDVDGTVSSQWKTSRATRHTRIGRSNSRRWHSLRRGWKHLGGSASRRSDYRADRGTHRDDSIAGKLRECLLRRSETKSSVHDGEPIAVLRVCRHDRSTHRVRPLTHAIDGVAPICRTKRSRTS